MQLRQPLSLSWIDVSQSGCIGRFELTPPPSGGIWYKLTLANGSDWNSIVNIERCSRTFHPMYIPMKSPIPPDVSRVQHSTRSYILFGGAQ